jgi:tRNA1Val (adenine37-N6)-methyltransferase
MNEYSQPSFYRFNEDSIKLIDFVLERHNTAVSILDMGTGSGIIGIELAKILKPKSLCLLEGQKEWLEYLRKNVATFLGQNISVEIIIETFGNWEPQKKFDLIVCNPPYFLPGHGEASTNQLRNNARSFVIDDWSILIKKVDLTLLDSGRAYFVIKDDLRIVKIIEENTKNLSVVKIKKEGLLFLELLRLNIN